MAFSGKAPAGNNSMKRYISLLRPNQWVKNFFIFAPVFFGGKLDQKENFIHAFDGMVLFSLAASSIYIINDLHDAASDRLHPVKKHRPIASGTITAMQAVLLSGFLAIV